MGLPTLPSDVHDFGIRVVPAYGLIFVAAGVIFFVSVLFAERRREVGDSKRNR